MSQSFTVRRRTTERVASSTRLCRVRRMFMCGQPARGGHVRAAHGVQAGPLHQHHRVCAYGLVEFSHL